MWIVLKFGRRLGSACQHCVMRSEKTEQQPAQGEKKSAPFFFFFLKGKQVCLPSGMGNRRPLITNMPTSKRDLISSYGSFLATIYFRGEDRELRGANCCIFVLVPPTTGNQMRRHPISLSRSAPRKAKEENRGGEGRRRSARLDTQRAKKCSSWDPYPRKDSFRCHMLDGSYGTGDAVGGILLFDA